MAFRSSTLPVSLGVLGAFLEDKWLPAHTEPLLTNGLATRDEHGAGEMQCCGDANDSVTMAGTHCWLHAVSSEQSWVLQPW